MGRLKPGWKKGSSIKWGKRRERFWIFKDNKAGKISIEPLIIKSRTKDQIEFERPKPIEGKTAIALFHTHPNTMKEKDSKGEYYNRGVF